MVTYVRREFNYYKKYDRLYDASLVSLKRRGLNLCRCVELFWSFCLIILEIAFKFCAFYSRERQFLGHDCKGIASSGARILIPMWAAVLRIECRLNWKHLLRIIQRNHEQCWLVFPCTICVPEDRYVPLKTVPTCQVPRNHLAASTAIESVGKWTILSGTNWIVYFYFLLLAAIFVTAILNFGLCQIKVTLTILVELSLNLGGGRRAHVWYFTISHFCISPILLTQ